MTDKPKPTAADFLFSRMDRDEAGDITVKRDDGTEEVWQSFTSEIIMDTFPRDDE